MPRNHHPGASTLRNRNRITNKTRLKIHHGNIDADALLIPDEDEEKHRLTNLVAGVDAEDANEHHLQEVLSASHKTQVGISRSTRGGEKPSAPAPAFIPTPDSTGIVENYEELYPPNRWKDPATYVSSSTSVEESTINALASGFTYFMDERDKEWLDKNNEEARGEGTSAQGSVSASGTRMSARSAKAKGKEPDVSQPVVISEDEFELVMGLFEKVTHEKTEYLHHGLETGMAFPAFSDYQETFSSPIPSTFFTSYTVPTWLPSSPSLLRTARTIYPFWKERRIERGGHRIIPTLNGDESDTLNESYICFRRREIKAVRKTRASQVTSSDKLTRLQAELSYPLELAKAILSRENCKKEVAHQAQFVWEKRQALVDLKRKWPAFGDKADEELLVDKERPAKRAEALRQPGLKVRTHDVGLLPPRSEIAIRPRERIAKIREQIETTMARQKDLDHHWEDMIDNVYQPPLVPYTSRFFKFIPPPSAPAWPSDLDAAKEVQEHRQPRAVRLRVGRGGRRYLDLRDAGNSRIMLRAKLNAIKHDDDMDVDDSEAAERQRQMEERWRYDMDDCPAVGPKGPDEQDRILVDEYDEKYIRYSMTLLGDHDQQNVQTDPSLAITGVDGRTQMIVPFRVGLPIGLPRRDATLMRAYHPSLLQSGSQSGYHASAPHAPPGGTPVSTSQQNKKMPPPSAVPQMRISSNGGIRPPGLPMVASMHTNGVAPHSSPPHLNTVPTPQHSPPNGPNGVSRAAITMPHVDVVKSEPNSVSAIANGVLPIQSDGTNQNGDAANGTPSRPKSQNQQMGVTANGFHLTPMTNYAAAALANSAQFAQHANQHGLSLQQVQTLKSAFAGNPDLAALQVNTGRPLAASYLHVPNGANLNMQLPAGTNINLKLPTARQMQWAAVGSAMQRPGSTVNGMEGQGMNGTVNSSPILGHAIPVRSPSSNGTRATLRNGNGHVLSNGQLSMSPHLQHSPPPMPSAISQSQSPPRLPMTPTMTMTSPSLQHQQPIGGTSSGY